MGLAPLHDNVALAIDGGGIKGLIIARALIALEDELGGKPLIEHPAIKILAGTSTGSVITAGIALGMKAAEIADLYLNLGQHVFPPLIAPELPKVLRDGAEAILMVAKTSLYSNEQAIQFLKDDIASKTGNPDFTLAELSDRLGPHKSLIMTVVNINERRTHFIKSYKQDYGDWKLWEAVMASSSAPVALPVFPHLDPQGKQAYYTDGGVGSYGNPAYIAAREAIEFQGYAPSEVSVLSFGTGWLNQDDYQNAHGVPKDWHGLNWALNAPLMIVDDNARSQSMDIIQDYRGQNLDFRRFQFLLKEDIAGDAFSDDKTYQQMIALGDMLGERIRNNQFAPNQDREIDPEGLQESIEIYIQAQAAARSRKS